MHTVHNWNLICLFRNHFVWFSQGLRDAWALHGNLNKRELALATHDHWGQFVLIDLHKENFDCVGMYLSRLSTDKFAAWVVKSQRKYTGNWNIRIKKNPALGIKKLGEQ